MAKSAAKPGSIPSYEQYLEKLSAELKAAEEERVHLEAQWRQKYMPEVEELIEFARRRKHPWAQKIGPENEGIVKETFLVWLYRSTEEQRKIRALETGVEDLKLRIRKAKKMLRLLEAVMNSIRNGLGMRETEIVKQPTRPRNPHFYAIFARVHNTL